MVLAAGHQGPSLKALFGGPGWLPCGRAAGVPVSFTQDCNIRNVPRTRRTYNRPISECRSTAGAGKKLSRGSSSRWLALLTLMSVCTAPFDLAPVLGEGAFALSARCHDRRSGDRIV